MSLGLVTAVALGGYALAQGTGGGSGTTADPAPGNPTARPTPVPPPAPIEPPPRADAITLSPFVIPVGKWPEGIASDGRYLWVAESGSRRIAKVDQRRGRIVSRVKVGRLPVQMMALADGRILSLVHTDKKLWQQPTPKGKGRTLARIGDCPVSMTGDSAGIWVATYVNCTGDKSKIFEIDPQTGKTRRRFDLQDGAFDISSNHQAVFVISTFRQDSTLTAIKKATGEIRRRPLQGARYHHIRARRGQLVAAGAVGDAGIVASLRQGERAQGHPAAAGRGARHGRHPCGGHRRYRRHPRLRGQGPGKAAHDHDRLWHLPPAVGADRRFPAHHHHPPGTGAERLHSDDRRLAPLRRD